MLPWLLVAAALAAELDRDTVPATGRQVVGLEVERFGRYAIVADGPQGTAVQLVDRMEGAGPVQGTPGAEDGRLDTFLERGDYRVVALSDPGGTGAAKLRVVPFDEIGGGTGLVEGRRHVAALRDLQQRTWWIAVDRRRHVALEGIGRHLADLRLWSHDGWLREEAPRCTAWEPAPGRPVSRCTLVAQLEPGLYQVTAYGGPSRPWTEPATDDDLTLIWGFPELGPAVRQVRTLPETGIERLVARPGTDTFRIALPDRAEATLAARPLDASDPYRPGGTRAVIDDESRVPEAIVRARSDEPVLVTVTGSPGQRYTLDALPAIGPRATVEGDGRYLVATVHAASPADVPDPTGLLVRHTGDATLTSATQGIALGGGQRWSRRFNLPETTRILLDLRAEESWTVRLDELEGRLRIEPFLVDRPADYEPPPWAEGALEATLPPGLHVLTVAPDAPGVATLVIEPSSWTARAREWVGAGAKAVASRPNLQWLDLPLDRGAPLELLRMEQPGVPTGLVVRELPLDPVEPVPLSVLPGEQLTLPVRLADGGVLEAIDGDGAPLPVSVGEGWADEIVAPPGAHTLQVRNPGDEVALITVRRRPDAPPPLSSPIVGPLPPPPSLEPGAPLPLDLDDGEEALLEVAVDRDGLYVLETTGLLATSAGVRTRTRTALADGAQNGVGRNARVARYLREGTYLARVRALPPSAGHLAVALRRTEQLDGGVLVDGAPARASVPADTAVAYTFSVEQRSTWHVRSFGRGGTLGCRLEDADGWPVGAPIRTCDLRETLDPGTYRIVGLPEALPTRRLTVAEREATPPEVVGHGPHRLALDRPASHRWREDDGRPPDVWTFDLPAPTEVTVALSDEMAGELVGPDGPVARIVPGRPLVADLAAGPHRLELRAARPNDRVPYTVTVRTTDLVPGVSRSLPVPGRATVAVGQRQGIELASFGTVDVRARLLDADGQLVAANDDRPDDWNFRLAARLDPGRYTLELGTLEGERGQVLVRVDAPAEIHGAPLSLGEARTVRPGAGALVLPVDGADDDEVVIARIAGAETVEATVEVQRDGIWTPVAAETGTNLALAARTAGHPARLRLRSLDLRGGELSVAVDAPRPSRSRRIEGAGLRRARAGLAVAHVREAPGLVALDGSIGLLRHCPDAPGPCHEVTGRTVPVPDGGLWLVGAPARLDGRRLALDGTEPVDVPLPADAVRSVDLAGSGPVAVIARAPAGQPGVSLDDARHRFAVGGGAALAVALDGAGSARLWSADGSALRATVRSVHLGDHDVRPLDAGLTELNLEPGGAVRLDLPGPHLVDAALEPGLALVAGSAVLWADRAPRQVSVSAGDAVWLVHVGDRPAAAVLEVTSGDAPALDLAAGPVERIAGRAGLIPIAVPPSPEIVGPVAEPPVDLHVSGAVEEATYVRADGRVVRGTALSAGPGGTLWVAHRAGPVLAWLGAAPPVAADEAAATVGGPARIALSGTQHTVAVALDAPALVQLRLPCPAVAEVEADGLRLTEVHPDGGAVLAWLPAGRGTIALRALGDGVLSGTATLLPSPAAEIGEGLGPEVLLPSGGAAAFRFTTERDGPVGIGLRARADRVRATLLGADGVPVGSGAALMPELPAGSWVLVLSQPADAPPVRVAPSLVGVAPPDTGPPPEVVETYLDAARSDATAGEPR